MITGKVLLIVGLLLALFGALLTLAPGLFRWFGKLPGDIHIQGNGFTLFIPITSMIVVSVILTVLIYLLQRR
ncbi:MAG: DUF2905 domain-containing protein [Methylococcaceae bacterium]|jgi:hypothetical protein|nr:DUF2905 domain-containing protein [Methylococcaceae bacterium]